MRELGGGRFLVGERNKRPWIELQQRFMGPMHFRKDNLAGLNVMFVIRVEASYSLRKRLRNPGGGWT